MARNARFLFRWSYCASEKSRRFGAGLGGALLAAAESAGRAGVGAEVVCGRGSALATGVAAAEINANKETDTHASQDNFMRLLSNAQR
jgi:hypothetical protein